MTGEQEALGPPAPHVPAATSRLPTLLLWVVPILLVLAYVLLINQFFHSEARWSGSRFIDALILLVSVTALLSIVWFATAYGASLLLGEYVTIAVLKLIIWIPGLNRHVIVVPPERPDTRTEVWARFGALFLVTLGFDLILLYSIVLRGYLVPHFAVDDPTRFFVSEAIAGILLAVLIAPAAPFLTSRLRIRITDSLMFPLLWLAAVLFAVGGTTVLLVRVLPMVEFDTALFFTSILLYAPAAWYVCLAFSATETNAQERFLLRAWKSRSKRLHFGRIQVVDEPEGTVTEV